jgi:putative endonuclease
MRNKGDLPHHFKLGKEGEAFAIDFVKGLGYKVLHTNWRFGNKEIDIVAKSDSMLVVFEVKTRHTNYWEEPKEAVKLRKQKNIIMATDAYINQYDINLDVQFDVISLIYNGKGFEIEHIPDAFYPIL